MLTVGKITKLVRDRGFGFSEDEAGQLYFFHYSSIDPRTRVKFEDLNEGNSIQFIAEPSEKGPRAKPRSLSLV